MSSRQIIDALLPPGAIWVPEDDGDLDKLFDGKALNMDATRSLFLSLAKLRSPLFTPDLEGLEREYGIVPDSTVDEATRRSRLLSAKTAGGGDGAGAFLQRQLRLAGFDVYVHENNPPVDPLRFLYRSVGSIFGTTQAVFGNESTFFGGTRGELVVNGPTYEHEFFSGTIFGGLKAVFGNEDAMFRQGGAFGQREIEYDLPTDAGYWPLVFFVGGEAVRNEAGELTEIAEADVELSRREELIRTIVKLKPIHAWAGLVIKFV